MPYKRYGVTYGNARPLQSQKNNKRYEKNRKEKCILVSEGFPFGEFENSHDYLLVV